MDSDYFRRLQLDKFYFAKGKCCACCDYWRTNGIGITGECTNSKIISSKERLGFLGWRNCTLDIGAGHAITRRDYVCGQFKDSFNWESLPILYLKQIGYRK